MQVNSYSELRRNLAARLGSVVNDHNPVLITRGRGKPVAVLISLADYTSPGETEYLHSSPHNTERLLRSVANLEAGCGADRTSLPPSPAPPHQPPQHLRQNPRRIPHPRA